MSGEVVMLASPGGCAAGPPHHMLDSPDYAIEQKLDGHRVLLIVQDGKCTALNRQGKEKDSFPKKIETLIANAPAISKGRWIFDGELLHGQYVVFDMIEMPNGKIDLQWMQRRLLLDKLFLLLGKNGFEHDAFQTTIWAVEPEEKWALYNACLDKEGVMFKEIHSTYRTGRQNAWIKHKFQKTCEVVVMELDRKGKAEAISIGLYDDEGVLREAGGCRLLPKFAGQVQVGDVIETRYLYATEDFKLYQPHMMHLRTDKEPEECGRWQLQMTNKSIART